MEATITAALVEGQGTLLKTVPQMADLISPTTNTQERSAISLATVAATNEGTNLSREIVTHERGEFAMPALPTGP